MTTPREIYEQSEVVRGLIEGLIRMVDECPEITFENFERRPLDGLAPTLTTRCGSQMYLLDRDRCRILNPRELARIQGFPDTYRLPANRDLAGRLIGNAIDVHLARGIMEQLL